MMRITLFIFALLNLFLVRAQQSLEPPLCLSSDEDQHLMMKTLGITKLRPGKNADVSASNSANYEESKANTFNELPELLVTERGKKVTTPEIWWSTRRPEIKHAFEEEVYGKIPENTPTVSWEVQFTETEYIGWTPVTAKKLIGHVDNSDYPLIDVGIEMVVVTPANAKGPVPILMMFGNDQLPAPRQPNPDEFDLLNQALRNLLARDSSVSGILEKYPAYSPLVRPKEVNDFGFYSFSGDTPRTHELINAGWGYALINPASIQADNGAGLTCEGIIALVNKGKPRKPDQWGALRAWSWGAARAMDYLETDSTVDAGHVGIEGVSRYGKAALVTMAFEERFAFGLIGSSGKGGTTLHRRNFGESVENLTGWGYYWMAGNYMKYGTEAGKLGRMDATDLPVDAHQLIAMCAPRPVFISYGIPEQGDAHWLDHQGSYMAAVAAGPIYKLLGKKDLGVSNDYMTERMPSVNEGMLEGHLAWRQHDGGHTDAPNIKYFIDWANALINSEK
ncbi:MAG: acetylxylan esterase [Marinoscillum sp.]